MPERPLVLIVDDDRAILEFIELALVEESYAVARAANGVQALEQIRARQPDLILLDLAMPEMDGEELCRRLRTDGLAGIPVVLMTASSRARQKARELGCAAWLGKPFELTELIGCVARHRRR